MSEADVANEGLLEAGAAMVDISPVAGTHLGGTWGVLRGAEVMAEPLYARAAVFQKAHRRICILAPELEVIVRKYTDRIRQGVSSRCGIDPDAIMVHLPQIHSTPPVGNFILDDDFPAIPAEHEYLRGAQSEYCDFAVEKIVQAAEEAAASLRPVQIAAGRGARDDLAFNRRAVLRDGSVTMPPPSSSSRDFPHGRTDFRFMEGPVDPEIGVFCARDDRLHMVTMLLHFTCHPVNVFAQDKYTVSSDWPGVWSRQMQHRFGPGARALVLNGCCGNINPWPPFELDFVPDHRRMGRALAESATRIIQQMRFGPAATLDWKIRTIKLPLKQARPEDRAAAEKLLAEHPEPIWESTDPPRAQHEWMDAAMLLCVERERERSPDYDYEIQVLRLGHVALVGLPGEPFVEAQLAIKIGSPAPFTFIAHGTTDYAGYIAPRASYARGGHEIREKPAKWAKLEPGSLETIVDNAISLLKEVF